VFFGFLFGGGGVFWLCCFVDFCGVVLGVVVFGVVWVYDVVVVVGFFLGLVVWGYWGDWV
ncbi:hypothetical protein, partial [Salmonella enterica]|uniref:hypothetical protein n=1 Tax=Salmonella enterica TaxID=28901 RepID=UPI00197D83C8